MLIFPLSRLNISCTCTECATFLRPYPKNPSATLLPGILLPTGLLGQDSPLIHQPASPLTSKPSPKPSSKPTHSLRATGLTLSPAPTFLLTRPNPPKLKTTLRGALSSTALSPLSRTWRVERVQKAIQLSLGLLFGLSSPMDDTETLLSAKTPGLALCGSVGCKMKVVPGFGRGVCGVCEGELKGLVGSMLGGVEETGRRNGAVSVVEAESSQEQKVEEGMQTKQIEEPKDVELFAVPATPLGSQSLRADSLMNRPRSDIETTEQPSDTPLFALPDVSLDTAAYEEVTPTTKYAMDFPALPMRADSVVQRDSAEIARPWVFLRSAVMSEPAKMTEPIKASMKS